MSKITIPKFLNALLGGDHAAAAVLDFANRVGVILADNKTCFFPNYTNHGVEHINGVLKSIEELIPDEVQEDKVKSPLHQADAIVIIGSTLLHDLAMHLTPAGFMELVSPHSRFKPLPWFDENQIDHEPDLPWHDLWADFEREARKYSDRDLARIIGEQPARQWKFDGLNPDPGQWKQYDMLVVGEFIRRHHARLAHEIAIYGFPGIPAGTSDDQFPPLGAKGSTLKDWADLIGVVARSHGTSLRVAHAYLKYSHKGTLQPMGCAALYPMAMLRVADYLQIEHQRAPAVLLHLRQPQSTISIDEWAKHKAVRSVTSADDPRGLFVTVSDDLAHTHFIQLRELLEGIQREMDHSVAVLDEVYGRCGKEGLDQLTLDKRRVHSNLFDQEFQKQLPYVPQETGFSADPNILSLLVKPLYGDDPSIGVRELMQNAVDAVRELHAWCDFHEKDITKLDLPDQEADVLLDFIEKEDGSWMLRVTDKGIGMTAETVQKYFLRAGASFRHSKEWVKEFTDDEGNLKVTRSGRFGIGAFAAFLLGDTVRVQTRHASAPPESGLALTYSVDSTFITLSRQAVQQVGTIVEVDIATESLLAMILSDTTVPEQGRSAPFREATDWYCWAFPTVVRRISRLDDRALTHDQTFRLDHSATDLPLPWNSLPWNASETLLWRSSDQYLVVHNGIRVTPDINYQPQSITWPNDLPIRIPNFSILDSQDAIELTLTRDKLADIHPEFAPLLAKDCCFSLIALSLLSETLPSAKDTGFQFLKLLDNRDGTTAHILQDGALHWCRNEDCFVPLDPWLLESLGVTRLFLFTCYEERQVVRKLTESSTPAVKHLDISPLLSGTSSPVAYAFLESRFPFSLDRQKILGRIILKSFDNLFHNSYAGFPKVRSGSVAFTDGGIDDISDAFGLRRSQLHWTTLNGNATKSPYYIASSGSPGDEKILLKLLKTLNKRKHLGLLFAADLEVETEDEPRTVLAKAWNECLGRRAIPLDPQDREELIEHGRKHERLRYHLDRWEERLRVMKEEEQ